MRLDARGRDGPVIDVALNSAGGLDINVEFDSQPPLWASATISPEQWLALKAEHTNGWEVTIKGILEEARDADEAGDVDGLRLALQRIANLVNETFYDEEEDEAYDAELDEAEDGSDMLKILATFSKLSYEQKQEALKALNQSIENE